MPSHRSLNRSARILIGILLIPAVISTGSVANANLLVNGSFEVGPTAGSFVNLVGGTTSINGWTVTGEGIDYIGSLWMAADGTRSLDLDGSVGSTLTSPFVHGGIAQTFSTTPGTNYLVTFDLAGNPFNLPSIKPMQVSAAGQALNFSFDVTGKGPSNMGWRPESWQFTANNVSTTLEFRSLTVSPLTGWGAALDNVAVTAVTSGGPGGGTSTIPEPGSFLLLGSGLSGFIAWRRMKRQA